MEYIVFNGKKSTDFGVIISGEGVYNAPARKYNSYVVPGRNGTLYVDAGAFDNIQITYPAAVVHEFRSRETSVRNWLLGASGYCELRDTYHPGEFRLARYSGGFTLSKVTQWHRGGAMNLTFDCKPQRFLDAGTEELSVPATGITIANPVLIGYPFPSVYAYPSIVLSPEDGESLSISFEDGAGNAFGGIAVDARAGASVYVNCEAMNASFADGSNANEYVTVTGCPRLPLDSETTLTAIGQGVATIVPRWWII